LAQSLQTLLGSAGALQLASNPALSQLLGGGLAALQPALGAVSSGAERDENEVRAQGLDPRRLFVGQITRECRDKAALSALFEIFGGLESVRFLEDKGVAYIQYATYESAKAAITAYDGKVVPGVSREQGLNVKHSNIR